MRFFLIFIFFIVFKNSTVFSFELKLDEEDLRLLLSGDSGYLLKDLTVGDTMEVRSRFFCKNNGKLYILDMAPKAGKSSIRPEFIVEKIPGQKVKVTVEADLSYSIELMIISPMKTCKEVLNFYDIGDFITPLEVETVNGFNNQKDYIQSLTIEGYN